MLLIGTFRSASLTSIDASLENPGSTSLEFPGSTSWGFPDGGSLETSDFGFDVASVPLDIKGAAGVDARYYQICLIFLFF